MTRYVEGFDVEISRKTTISTEENANVKSLVEEPKDTIDLMQLQRGTPRPSDRSTKHSLPMHLGLGLTPYHQTIPHESIANLKYDKTLEFKWISVTSC
jgi:hypothetical protein